MARSARLLDLLQVLRRHRRPVTGKTLAAELGVSVRTLYRDIATLQGQGAPIEGEAGLGYVLQPGFLLPPLMLSQDEIEAVMLGIRWVAGRTDAKLAAAGRDALAKIGAVLPEDLREALDDNSLLVPRWGGEAIDIVDLSILRDAIRRERVTVLQYRDVNGQDSERPVWPFALGFFEKTRMLVAWCELRQDFRHFRTDRITSVRVEERRYGERRQKLLKRWREQEQIAAARN